MKLYTICLLLLCVVLFSGCSQLRLPNFGLMFDRSDISEPEGFFEKMERERIEKKEANKIINRD